MRFLLIGSIIVAGAALLLPAAAPAFTGPLHGRPDGQAAAAGHSAPAFTTPQRTTPIAPYRRVLSGSATVIANVYTFAGLPEVADVLGYVWGDGDFAAVIGATDAAGVATLTSLPAAGGNGEIVVLPAVTPSHYDITGLSWPAAGTVMSLQPGRLPMTIHRGNDPYYNRWSSVRVDLTAQETAATSYAGTDIPGTGTTVSGDAATITALGPATLHSGAIYYGIGDEGAELDVAGIAVSSGATAAPTVEVYEKDARGVWTNGWGSGKPGATAWLGLERYPAGWINKVRGKAAWPASATPKSFSSLTTRGGSRPQLKKVTIPSTVKPGYAYNFTVSHTDGPLVLKTRFQTCSLVPSKTTISRGDAVRLSGVIPTQGHLGSTPGKAKSVVIYKRTTSAGQPRHWDATRSGWTKVGVIKADRYGKYRSALLHPARSTWYVVRYPSDNEYWGAFTSVRKVNVR